MSIDVGTLIEWSIRSSLFLSGILLLTKVMGNRISASLRHTFLVVGIVGAVAIPLLGAVLPGWGVIPSSWWDQTKGMTLVDSIGDSNKVATSSARETMVVSWQELVILMWVLGAVLLMSRVLIAMHRVRMMAGAADRGRNKGEILCVLGEAQRKLGIESNVQVSLGPEAWSPMTVGGIRPKILLPETARGWDDERLTVVLMHELAHVRRQDVLIRTLVAIFCVIQWFNPLFWIVRRRIEEESEIACDDLVLRAGFDPVVYSQQLLNLAKEDALGRQMVGVAGMARPSEIENRLLCILDDRRNRVSSAGKTRIGLLSIVVLLLPLAMVARAKHQIDSDVISEFELSALEEAESKENESRSSVRGPFLRPEFVRSASISFGEAIRGNINDHLETLRDSRQLE